MRTYFLVVCVVMAATCLSQSRVEGIQCYKCNSFVNSKCAGKDLEEFKYNCSDDPLRGEHPNALCRLVYQELEFQVDGAPTDIRIFRDCGWNDPKYQDKCYNSIGLGGKQIVCACTDNLCNSAPRSGHVIAITMIAALTAFFYLKLV